MKRFWAWIRSWWAIDDVEPKNITAQCDHNWRSIRRQQYDRSATIVYRCTRCGVEQKV